MNNDDRDRDIIDMYQHGVTQDELAIHFKITPGRVWQIVHEAGLTRADRDSTMSARTQYIGVHVTTGVKEALKKTAEDEGKSMSSFVSGLVETELKARGVSIEEIPSTEIDVPLSLESA